MREVFDLAKGMKTLVANLRREALSAKGEFQVEVSRAIINTEKVRSMAKDLKSANLEVEDFLGETGSNFHSSENLSTPQSLGNETVEKPTIEAVPRPRIDSNGVSTNPEAKQ